MSERVGVIGLGNMGMPMARNLLRAGYTVACCDMDADRVVTLQAEGATPAASPAELAAQADVILASLPSAAAVIEVVEGADGLVQAGGEGKVFIDTSTIPPPVSERLAGVLEASGTAMLDAPVSGGKAGAAAGTLSIMVGGPAQVFERCRPMLEVLGSRIALLGERVGAGGYAKLVNQIMVGLHMAAMAEAFTFAGRAGVDMQTLLPLLEGGRANSEILRTNAPGVLARSFDPVGEMGPLRLMHKDLGCVLEAAQALGVAMPLTPQVHAMYQALIDEGRAETDCMALLYMVERAMGTEE